MKNISIVIMKIMLLTYCMFASNRIFANNSDWMDLIEDQTKLSQMAIPGTHDSGAYNIPLDLGETQDWNIADQLNNGIRFFDIRIANNSTTDDFEIRHGFERLGSFNRLVMRPVEDFLMQHPQETILMSIKDEDTLDVVRLETDYIYHPNGMFYQGSINADTRLSEVRGKIVLVNRYNGSNNRGINWGNAQMKIQDDYNLDVECREIPTTPWTTQRVCLPIFGLDYPKKFRAVMAHLDQAINHYGQSNFWINFTSANYNGLYIGNNAAWVNPRTRDYFYAAFEFHKIGSIVIMDYPNRVAGLIDSIINNSIKSHGKNIAKFTTIPQGVLNSQRADGYWGSWGGIEKCPEGMYVYGYKIKVEPPINGDDTALNGIQLICGNGSINNPTISSKIGPWGNWSGWRTCSSHATPVTGFDIKIEGGQGSGDDTAANDIDLYCQNGTMLSATGAGPWGTWTPKYSCPVGQAVMGLITRVEDPIGSGDDTAFNGLRLICKDY